jgi:hypothetical protein
MLAAQTYYLNADKSKVVKEGKDGEVPTDAAYLLVREGGEISDEDVEKFKLKTKEAEPEPEAPAITISGQDDPKPGEAPATEKPTVAEPEGTASKKTAKKSSKKGK